MSYTCEIEYTIRVTAFVESFCVSHKDAEGEALRYGEDDITAALVKYMESDDTTVVNEDAVEFINIRVLGCEPNFNEDADDLGD